MSRSEGSSSSLSVEYERGDGIIPNLAVRVVVIQPKDIATRQTALGRLYKKDLTKLYHQPYQTVISDNM